MPLSFKIAKQDDILDNDDYVIQHNSSAFERAGGRSIYKKNKVAAPARSMSLPKLLMSGKNVIELTP